MQICKKFCATERGTSTAKYSTLGQENNTIFRNFKPLHFYDFGNFGNFDQKLAKIVKILKYFISGKVYSQACPNVRTKTEEKELFS